MGRSQFCAVGGAWEGACVGGLEGALEDGDCVVLGCDIAEVLGATRIELETCSLTASRKPTISQPMAVVCYSLWEEAPLMMKRHWPQQPLCEP